MASPQTNIKNQIDELIREALTQRFGVKVPAATAAPLEVREALYEARARLDRVEELLGKAVLLAATAREFAGLATATLDDAWDEKIVQLKNSPVRQGSEYPTARERHAEANLAVLDLRRKSRAADEVVAQCEKAVTVIRLAHRGLEGVRQDFRTWLDAFKFESHLDR